jgi:hypothetical protein
MPAKVPAWAVAHVWQKRVNADLGFGISRLILDLAILFLNRVEGMNNYLTEWIVSGGDSIAYHAIIYSKDERHQHDCSQDRAKKPTFHSGPKFYVVETKTAARYDKVISASGAVLTN